MTGTPVHVLVVDDSAVMRESMTALLMSTGGFSVATAHDPIVARRKIAAQRPDGAEIVAAMKRARAAPDGTVRWTETCYCPTPLKHERATVFDRYFTAIETRVIDKPETFDGAPLMDRLASP